MERQYEIERQFYHLLLFAIPVAYYIGSAYLMKHFLRPKQPLNRYYNLGFASLLYAATLLVYVFCREVWDANLKIVNATLLWHIPLSGIALLAGLAAFFGARSQATI